MSTNQNALREVAVSWSRKYADIIGRWPGVTFLPKIASCIPIDECRLKVSSASDCAERGPGSICRLDVLSLQLGALLTSIGKTVEEKK